MNGIDPHSHSTVIHLEHPFYLAFFTTLSIRDVKANYQKAKSPKLSKSQKIPKVSKSVKSPKKLKSMMLQLERNY